MTAPAVTATRRAVTYERVSSEDQRERETIKTQTDALTRRLAQEADVTLLARYADDGVSGTIPLAERPAGSRLFRDAAAGAFSELWVYKLDRLGRDAVDLLVVRRRFLELGIRVISVIEAEPDLLSYDVQAVVADHARREFLQRSADGMARAAREGRYTGGIVPYGYRVDGRGHAAHLVPDETIVWADRSAAALVRRIYARLALDGWSCRRVAQELNALGVPTHYARDERLVKHDNRKARTQAVWRAGHVRNLVVNPVYKGELVYGRRTQKERERITASIEGLVSPALWQAAQATLAGNRLCPKQARREYLLRGLIRCGVDGLAYTGAAGRGDTRHYRCDGKFVERGPLEGRCFGRYVQAAWLEDLVWADVERWLRDPGDAVAGFDAATEREAAGAVAVAESITLSHALAGLDAQRKRALDLGIRGHLSDAELDGELTRIATDRAEIERRLAALRPEPEADPDPTPTQDLLAEIRSRLDEGLSAEQRGEICRLLVRRIVVHTTQQPDGGKDARIVIEYRFPRPGDDRANTCTGRGSSPRSAARGPETGRSPGRARS